MIYHIYIYIITYNVYDICICIILNDEHIYKQILDDMK